MKLTYRVEEHENGRTVKSLLRGKIGLSSTIIRKLKKCGGIAVNNQAVYIKDRVEAGDMLSIDLKDDNQTAVEPQNIPLKIIYEDEHLLVVDKPPHMLVHPLKHERYNTLANAVIYYYQQNNLKTSFRPVYRLDRDTSGLVVIAKHAVAGCKLSQQLHSSSFCRRYLAVVHGIIYQRRAAVALPITRCPDSSVKHTTSEQGKKAVTYYHVEKYLDDSTLVKLELKTGRTHQIRVHLSAIGFPLVGDTLYGGRLQGINRQALHCYCLELIHPITGKQLLLEVSPPDDMLNLIL